MGGRECSLISGEELKRNNVNEKGEEDDYRQGWDKGNEVTLENANANGQDQVIRFVDATILRCNLDAVTWVLYLPDNLPQTKNHDCESIDVAKNINYLVPEKVSSYSQSHGKY